MLLENFSVTCICPRSDRSNRLIGAFGDRILYSLISEAEQLIVVIPVRTSTEIIRLALIRKLLYLVTNTLLYICPITVEMHYFD